MRTKINAKNLLIHFSVLHFFFCASTLVLLCWLSAAVYLIPYFFPDRNSLQTQIFGINCGVDDAIAAAACFLFLILECFAWVEKNINCYGKLMHFRQTL